jgi:hypothetical protein
MRTAWGARKEQQKEKMACPLSEPFHHSADRFSTGYVVKVEGHRCFPLELRSLNSGSLAGAACPSRSVGQCGRCRQVVRAQ